MQSKVVLASRIAVAAQFAALIRCLAQFFWLQHAFGSQLAIVQAQPFILSALVTAVCLVLSVFLSFANKHRAVIVTAALNVLVLFALKFWLL
jgi:hypothetical protein